MRVAGDEAWEGRVGHGEQQGCRPRGPPLSGPVSKAWGGVCEPSAAPRPVAALPVHTHWGHSTRTEPRSHLAERS